MGLTKKDIDEKMENVRKDLKMLEESSVPEIHLESLTHKVKEDITLKGLHEIFQMILNNRLILYALWKELAEE